MLNTVTELYDLIIEINGLKTVVSTSKSYGHWQYHFNRGTLAKGLVKHGIDSFVYVGFSPTDNQPTKDSAKTAPLEVQAAWFQTNMLCKQEVRKRGRPRKQLPPASGTILHKFDEEEPAFKLITPIEREVIERNFKMFLKSMDLKESIEEIALKFEIPYKQAFELVKNI